MLAHYGQILSTYVIIVDVYHDNFCDLLLRLPDKRDNQSTPEKRMTRMEELFTNLYELVLTIGWRRYVLVKFFQVMLKKSTDEWDDSFKEDYGEREKFPKDVWWAYRSEYGIVTFPGKHRFWNEIGDGAHLTRVYHGGEHGIEHIKKEKIKNKRCYLGEELTYHNQMFYVFSPNNSADSKGMAQCFQTLVEMGIYHVWKKEAEGLQTSGRVQDRARVKSPTHAVEDVEKFHQLELEGKLHNVFKRWGICVGCSVLVFLKEVSRTNFTGRIKGRSRVLKRREIEKVERKSNGESDTYAGCASLQARLEKFTETSCQTI